MKILSATDLAWADAAHGAIDMRAVIEIEAAIDDRPAVVLGPVSFRATPTDPEMHGRDAFERAVAGDFGAIAAFPDPSLAEIRAARLSALRGACAAAITGGFVSSALGSAHRYPSGATDQTNLMGSVVASMLPGLAEDWSTPFWCADPAGVWAFVPHAAGEIQQVGADGKAHVVTCQSALDRLTAALTAAATVDEIAAIVWE